jgi:hypothetical protein
MHLRAMMLGLTTTLVLLPCRAEAQTAPAVTIQPGQRVRITSSDHGMLVRTGTALYSRGDSLGVRLEGSDSTTVLPMSRVDKLEMSRGSRRHALHGLGIGVLLGTVMGMSVTSDSECEWGPGACVVEEVSKVGAIVAGSIAFGLVGTGIGALIKTERWTTVPLGNSRVGFRAMPSRNGVTLAGEFRF